jgi:hypothetical protein
MNDVNAQLTGNTPIVGVVTPLASWLYYKCDVHTELDGGIVLHKPLPQSNFPVDTLSSPPLPGPRGDAPYDYRGDVLVDGVNLASQSRQSDIVQRMATSTYRVQLTGIGIRCGYRVPIPSLFKFGGQEPVYDHGWADEGVLANYSGVPVYYSRWELWYHVTVPPRETQVPPPNHDQHIRGDQQLPAAIFPPITTPQVGAQRFPRTT